MDEHLKHLKESMNRTVLKDGSFRADEKRRILQAIQQQNMNRRRQKRRWGVGITVAVCFCLLIGLSWIVYAQLQDGSNLVASQSSKEMIKNDIAADKSAPKSDSSDNTVQPSDHANLTPFDAQKDNKSLGTPKYPYVILNGYYYKETGELVDKDKLGLEIGRVKRTGEWTVSRAGDSNNIQPGPIYAIHGKDPAIYVAAKGSIVDHGNKETGYLIFKKFEPIRQ